MENLFEEFKSATKTDWKAKATKDLKGKALEDLNWNIDKNITIEPYYTQADINTINHSALLNQQAEWEIGETLFVENEKQANKQLLKVLNEGVNAPVLDVKLKTIDFKTLLENIGLQYITTHFIFEEYNIEIVNELLTYLNANYANAEKIKGTISFSKVNANQHNELKDLIDNSPFLMRHLIIDARPFHTDSVNTSQELNQIKQALTHLKNEHKTLNNRLVIKLSIGKSYFIEIAKIRALKLMLHTMGIENAYLMASFPASSFSDNEHNNLINTSTLAMSAIIGGINHLDCTPPNGKLTRIARNTQLLLKHESHFDQLNDVAQGSYYIETLTKQLLDQL